MIEGRPARQAKIVAVICRRELVRFVRQPARVAAAIGTPALLLLFLASGFAGAFRPAMLEEVSYGAFLLPGMMTLVAVFASIFSSISLIEDRNEGWLQAALVSPASRASIALGKIAGGSIMAFAQSAILLAASPLVGLHLSLEGALVSITALVVTCIAMSALGFAFAWKSETTGGFHAVMNLVFLPMWMLSGAFFPPPPAHTEGAASLLGFLMWANPLTWCTTAIRQPLLGDTQNVLWALAAACGFGLAMICVCIIVAQKPRLTF